MLDWDGFLHQGGEAVSGPLHSKVERLLRRAAEILPPGSQLPGEIECATKIGVSRETVRRAIARLAAEGILVSRRGKGTFVCASRVETPLNRVQGFTEAVALKGRIPGTRVVRIDREVPDTETGQALSLPPRADVWALERLRLIDGHPAIVETAYLPHSSLPGFDKLDLERSLYAHLETSYDMAPVRGEESIFAVNADRRLDRQLDVPIASALLASVRVCYARGSLPIERTLRFVRPDLCSYVVALQGPGGFQVRAPGQIDAVFPAEVVP